MRPRNSSAQTHESVGIVNILDGALDTLHGSGLELVVHPCDSRCADLIDGVRTFVQQQKLHGVILLPPLSENQELADAVLAVDGDWLAR